MYTFIMKRIAICYFGLLRSFSYTFQTHNTIMTHLNNNNFSFDILNGAYLVSNWFEYVESIHSQKCSFDNDNSCVIGTTIYNHLLNHIDRNMFYWVSETLLR